MTVSVSGSMSGCMKRLNSTRPSAPARSSRRAISPGELKYGPSLTATGMLHRRLDRGEDLDVAAARRPAAPDQRVTGQVVDVQLDRGGARLLHGGRVVGPAARGDAVQAGDDRDVHGAGGPLDQAEVRWGPGSYPASAGSSSAIPRSCPCRPRPARVPPAPPARSCSSNSDGSTTAPPRRRPAADAVERAGSGAAEATSGLRSSRPGTGWLGPSRAPVCRAPGRG